jgi:uncharacterized membrane protein YgdD (TMEM256/DUF423 family)
MNTDGKLPTMTKFFLFLGSVNMFLVVILGAFGAHGLKERHSPEMMAAYQTGIQYHFYHAAGLLIVGILSFFLQMSSLIRWSGFLMVVGIVIFSGTLYLLSVTGARWLGAITPVGGTAFVVAWFLLAMACLKAVRRNTQHDL